MDWRKPPEGGDLPLRRLTDRAIWLLVLAFVALAGTYSIVTPLYEAPDEAFHYPLVKHLADGHGLPVLDPANLQPWHQEGGQPPLYYALTALVTRWVPSDDLSQILLKYPHSAIGQALPDGHANAAIHTPGEAFPYRGAVLAIHLARGFSVLLGALTVFFTYLIGLEVLPRRPGLALAAAGVVACTPMFLFLSGAVNNDNLVITLATISLWQMLRLLRLPPTLAQWTLLGALIGLAALSKVSALGLLPLAALVLCWVAWRRRDWKLVLWGGVCIVGATALVAGWWYYRNWRLYGDPMGLSTFLAAAGRRETSFTLQTFFDELPGFFLSYWGAFGWVNLTAPDWFYRLLNGLALVACAGLAVMAGRRIWQRRWPDVETASRLALVAIWPLMIVAGLIRYTVLIPASVGRLAFPAISCASFLLALGLSSWAPRRWRGLPLLAGPALMAGLAVWVPFGVIAPAYARPPLLTPAEQAQVPNRLDLSIGQGIELLGYQVGATEVKPGEYLPVTLYWRAKAPMERNYSVFIHLLNKDGGLIVQRDAYPGRGALPTTLWQPGDAFADTYLILIPPTLTRPIHLKLKAGVYRFADRVRLPIRDRRGEAIGDYVDLGELLVCPAACERIMNPVSFNLGNQVALVGYNLDRTTVHPGETFHLTLFWKALVPPARDYTAFTHLLGSGNAILAQEDLPLEDVAPVGGWQAGEVLCDSYELTVQPGAPAGLHDLEVGLYQLETMGRLPLLGPDGRLQGTRILLPPIRVTEADGR